MGVLELSHSIFIYRGKDSTCDHIENLLGPEHKREDNTLEFCLFLPEGIGRILSMVGCGESLWGSRGKDA